MTFRKPQSNNERYSGPSLSDLRSTPLCPPPFYNTTGNLFRKFQRKHRSSSLTSQRRFTSITLQLTSISWSASVREKTREGETDARPINQILSIIFGPVYGTRVLPCLHPPLLHQLGVSTQKTGVVREGGSHNPPLRRLLQRFSGR